jgi:hypothetical protein
MRRAIPPAARTAVLTGCLLLVGCGLVPAGGPTGLTSPSVPTVPATPQVTTTHGYPDSGSELGPPPFVVLFGSTRLELAPFTYCYHSANVGVCADGFGVDPPSIGSPAQIVVFVPVGGMDHLSVTQSIGKGDCGRLDASVRPLGGGWWSVQPSGPAANYRVSLFASGGGDDMVADVLWRTPDGVGAATPAPTCPK